jgi:lysophospholipase L1-like esterase
MRQVLFWAGFALVLPQAIWVRSRARRFADAGGERTGRIPGSNPKRLLALGDSIIAGVGCSTLERACVGQTASRLAAALDSGLEWQAIGQTGATTGQILKHLLPRLPDAPIDFIVVSAGVNDITALKSLAHWEAALNALIDGLRVQAPGARIAVLGIPPMHCFPRLPQPLRYLFGLRARGFDETARRVLTDLDDVVYVPFEGEFRRDQFAPDGYHPSEDSCAEIAAEVVSALTAD